MLLSGRALFYSLVLSLLVVSRSLLVTASKDKRSNYNYDPATVVLTTEAFKLFIAMGLYVHERSSLEASQRKPWTQDVDRRVALLYSVPALLYAIQNNIVFLALLYLAPPTFELFSNLKIVTTAIVFYLALRRPLTSIQWTAVLLLFLGTVLGQLPSPSAAPCESVGSVDAVGSESAAGQVFGFFLCVIYAVLSAFAGIYTEKLLKGSRQSIHLQNMEIYFWSLFVNGAIAAWNGTNLFSMDFFRGYDTLTWTVILNGALMGQCVSFVMKYADNIVKVFAASLAMLISTLLSFLFFGFVPSPPMLIGCAVVSVSLYLYFGSHNQLLTDAANTSASAAAAAAAKDEPRFSQGYRVIELSSSGSSSSGHHA